MSYPGDLLNRFGQQADRHARPGAPGQQQPRSPRFSWVPIRSLAARHRDRIEAHLVALEPGDRYLRFGFPASDEQIRQYVQGIRFDRDEVFGIFNRRLQLIAMAHLAYEALAQQHARQADDGGIRRFGAASRCAAAAMGLACSTMR